MNSSLNIIWHAPGKAKKCLSGPLSILKRHRWSHWLTRVEETTYHIYIPPTPWKRHPWVGWFRNEKSTHVF